MFLKNCLKDLASFRKPLSCNLLALCTSVLPFKTQYTSVDIVCIFRFQLYVSVLLHLMFISVAYSNLILVKICCIAEIGTTL